MQACSSIAGARRTIQERHDRTNDYAQEVVEIGIIAMDAQSAKAGGRSNPLLFY